MGIEHATPAMLLILLVLLGPVLYYIRQVRSGKNLFVRQIAGVDAINEAVGRAAEIGRPISFSTGLSGVGPVLYACLAVLFHVAKKAALYRTRLILPQVAPDVMAIADDVYRDAFRVQGKSSDYDPQSVVYLSDEQFAFAAGYQGLIHRNNVGSAFLFGEFAAESLILAEAGQQVGAMQVAASYTPEQVAFFITGCDYTLIGEELFAASAYLTREPVQMGSLYGQDRAKLFFLLLIVIGVFCATLKSIYPDKSVPNIDGLIRTSWSEMF